MFDRGSELVTRFAAGTIDPAGFDHRRHVEVAYGLLQQHTFLEAARVLADGLQGLASRAGAPEKFHLTITLVFLSAIAERMLGDPGAPFEDFWTAHPELHDDRLLRGAYSEERLAGEASRTHLLLPDRLPTTGTADSR